MPSASEQHFDDLPSTSQNTIGKKKSRAKFPWMLCKGHHVTHIFPHMEEASKFPKYIIVSQPQLLVSYCKITLDPPVVDGTINLSLSSVSLIDQVVNLVTSLVEPVDTMVDMIPSSVNPTLPLKSET
jgi:hypothetical protein